MLGPSGSGKTTLLTMIAGLAGPSAGRIDIGGRDVTRLPAAKRNVGLVFQSYALFPHMSVHDNVAFPLSVRRSAGEIDRRVAEALRSRGLAEPSAAGRRSSAPAGAVALARALVEPEILPARRAAWRPRPQAARAVQVEPPAAASSASPRSS